MKPHYNSGQNPRTVLLKASNTSRQTSAPAANLLVRVIREGALIGLVAICLYLLMALFSYSAVDPGWSKTGGSLAIRNVGGPAGAWLSDVFFSLFGYLAYLHLKRI